MQLAELATAERAEVTIDSGLTYDGIRPVLVRISKRDGRYKVTDDGAAVSSVGTAHVVYPDRIDLGAYSVNVSRQGVVSLPAVTPDEAWLDQVCGLVARGSVALYERLLDAGD